MKQKVKLAIILGVEFLATAIVLLLIFFATKKQYTITFDLDGGTLISGSLTQSVTQGHNATPPAAVKEGHYLRGWSGSYKGVTSDERVTAIWEYETTPGIEYSTKNGATYTEISGCFQSVSGKLYIGAYHKDLIVFGIKSSAFANCRKITDIYLLDGIITIGERAFANCESLEVIELPNTATVIGDGAFEGCKKLKTVVLPRALETLGDGAFVGCDTLETVYLPDTLSNIGEEAFMGCKNLKNVIFYSEEDFDPNAETKNEDDEKESDEKESPELDEMPEELEYPALTVSKNAFASCVNLERIIFPNGLTVIEDYAFKGCQALLEVGFGENLESIGEEAFLGCTSLLSAELSNTLTTLGRAAFKSCRSLKSITIPSGVTFIPEDAFNGCSSVISITLSSGVEMIASGAFKSMGSLEYVIIPKSVTVIGSGAFDKQTLTVYFERNADEPTPVGYAPSWYSGTVHFIFGYNGEEIVTDKSNESAVK